MKLEFLKNNSLIIWVLVFFLLVNTSYFWEVQLGFLAMPAILILFLGFCVLFIALVVQLFYLMKDKFKNRKRLLTIGLISLVLLLTYLKPSGLVNFDRLQGNDVLIAQIEGVANCMSTLRLKEGNNFSQRTYCFGAEEITGKYYFNHDTIYFKDIKQGRDTHAFYQFAVMRPADFNEKTKDLELVLYKKMNDTIGISYWIVEVDLEKLKHKQMGR